MNTVVESSGGTTPWSPRVGEAVARRVVHLAEGRGARRLPASRGRRAAGRQAGPL